MSEIAKKEKVSPFWETFKIGSELIRKMVRFSKSRILNPGQDWKQN